MHRGAFYRKLIWTATAKSRRTIGKLVQEVEIHNRNGKKEKGTFA